MILYWAEKDATIRVQNIKLIKTLISFHVNVGFLQEIRSLIWSLKNKNKIPYKINLVYVGLTEYIGSAG